MHDLPFGQGQGQLLWLFSGTGEGPRLAEAWLDLGWSLEVFVVSASAARSYPARPGLMLRVGAVGDRTDLQRLLERARSQGQAPLWIVDATHPFATRISTDLALMSEALAQPLVRLTRPVLQLPDAAGTTVIPDWQALTTSVPYGARVLLAIGARQLPLVGALLPGRVLHARVLPTAESLATALAAGVPSDQLAPLHPGGADQELLQALCRRWRIDTVVARASGGRTERGWRQLARELGLQLLLLQRPALVLPGLELPWASVRDRLSRDAGAQVRSAIPGDAGPAG